MSTARFHMLAKVREKDDSLYRSYVVHASSPLDAGQRLRDFLARSGSTLLGIDATETRPAESFPADWALPAISPEGVVGMSGRAFVLRPLSREGFREIGSMEFATLPADEIAARLVRVCREMGWAIVAFTGSVRLGRHADELRHGLRCARVIREETVGSAVLGPMLASEEGRSFVVDAAALEALRTRSGVLCTRRALQREALDRAAIFVDGGAFIGPEAVDGVVAAVLAAVNVGWNP